MYDLQYATMLASDARLELNKLGVGYFSDAAREFAQSNEYVPCMALLMLGEYLEAQQRFKRWIASIERSEEHKAHCEAIRNDPMTLAKDRL